MRAGCQGRPGLGAGRLGLGTAVRCLWQEPAPRRVSLRAVRLLTAVEGLRAGMGAQVSFPGSPRFDLFGSFCEQGHFLESCHSGA